VGSFSYVFPLDQTSSNATEHTRHWSCSKNLIKVFIHKSFLEKRFHAPLWFQWKSITRPKIGRFNTFFQKQKVWRWSTRLTFSEKTNNISPPSHNFRLHATKHRGQTELSAKILKTGLKTDEVYP